jgi:DNA segregation ATPase FtsK/SpoIIIE-like protein
MLLEKTAQRSRTPRKSKLQPGAPTSVVSEHTSLLAGEVLRILWLSATLFVVLALATYSSEDPSWSTWSSKIIFHNWMGRVGSIVSDLLIQIAGVGSIATILVMLLLSAQVAETPAKPSEKVRRALLAGMWLVSFSTLCQIALPQTWAPWNLKHPGGVIGFGVEKALLFLVGSKGSVLVAWVLVLVFSVLFFERQLLSPLWKQLLKLQHSLVGALAALRNQTALWIHNYQARRARAKSQSNAEPTIGGSIPVAATVASPATLSQTVRTAQAVLPTFAANAHLESHALTHPSAPAANPAAESAAVSTTDSPAPSPGDSLAGVEIESIPDEEIFKLAAPKVPKPVKESSAQAKARKKSDPYHLPSLQLLSGRRDNQVKTVDRSWYVEKSQVLVQKLKDFGVDGEVVHISPGPVITVFEFKPASGVKIKEIANLSDDLTLALSVLSVRIVAPIPGKPVVGIEIPTPHRQTVYFKDMLEETPFFNNEMKIPVVLGRLASGEPVVTGLASMPHLLVAGSTGTGKSVFINNLICSLLYRYTPQQLKLILVDPKMVELASYEGIPHLMLPVVVDSRKAALALRWVVDEMERRYALMHQSGVRHVDAYNDKRNQELNGKSADEMADEEFGPLPYIVVVIDEYADLMAVVPKDVELSIARLAQKARASGIHLVLATQRPSTDVVTGTIKANFPSRISFRVASSVDSKTILDRPGAERLLGNGDMLFHSAGFTTLKRIQGAFLSDADIEGVVEFLKSQGEPEYDERLLEASVEGEEDSEGGGGPEDGSLYDQAVRLVTEKGEASISLIQRHLKIGYNRAASLMEELEKEGVVGGASGTSKRRQVLVNSI